MAQARVINGFLGGRRISCPCVSTTRPTSDAFKKVIFDVLTHNLISSFDNYTVVDLFAGSGALGIEAISLGCKKCYFVDHNKSAMSVIYENVKKLAIEEYSILCCYDYWRFLRGNDIDNLGECGLVIFLDPPYSRHSIIPGIIACCSENYACQKITFVVESCLDISKDIDVNVADLVDVRCISGKWLTIYSSKNAMYC